MLLLERGVVVTYEAICCWCDNLGAGLAPCAKMVQRKPRSNWLLNEMFVTPRDEPYVSWRVVSEHGAEQGVMSQLAVRNQQATAWSFPAIPDWRAGRGRV
ncbi:hypothetical protein [Paraburkholderia sp. BL27I4N3]|uniref:hypothetical protein n=1 Tax=Paraburkholderia sp. BL27I4N3 TaxID=1938805 RepID=UPI000E27D7E7|nr:hypothetical protein [Paraburkholderia sp. BL27I4N3]